VAGGGWASGPFACVRTLVMRGTATGCPEVLPRLLQPSTVLGFATCKQNMPSTLLPDLHMVLRVSSMALWWLNPPGGYLEAL